MWGCRTTFRVRLGWADVGRRGTRRVRLGEGFDARLGSRSGCRAPGSCGTGGHVRGGVVLVSDERLEPLRWNRSGGGRGSRPTIPSCHDAWKERVWGERSPSRFQRPGSKGRGRAGSNRRSKEGWPRARRSGKVGVRDQGRGGRPGPTGPERGSRWISGWGAFGQGVRQPQQEIVV